MDLSRFLKRQGAAPAPQESGEKPALAEFAAASAGRIAAFLAKTQLFDAETYLRLYPEVKKQGVEPLRHFVQVGIHGGRNFTSPRAVARLWREVLRGEAPPERAAPALTAPERHRVAIYVSSLGNFFMQEIAAILKAGFDDLGVVAALRDENAPPQSGATHHIVVAPHEFFVLGNGRRFASEDFLARAVLFSTEQIQTQWFALSLPYLTRAKAVGDMNPQTAAILRKGGLKAVTAQPGFTPSFAPFAGGDAAAPDLREYAARPVDVAFTGTHSARREKLLASYAPLFAEMRTFIYYSRTRAPLRPETTPMAAPEASASLIRRSKVLINLHRDEYTYFEWWRIMQAFWMGAAVVSEPCFPHPAFKPGIHYFEESGRHIAHLAQWLARSDEGAAAAQAMRARAFDDLRTLAPAKNAALALLHAGGTA